MPQPRTRAPGSLPFGLLLLAALVSWSCADAAPPTAPDGSADLTAFARGGGKGGGGGGKGGGGGGGGDDDAPPITDELDPWDPALWIPGDHALGRGWLDPANVSQGPGTLLLTLAAGTYDGAEVRSAERVRFRTVEARMRTPLASGSISAFFLYEFVLRRNDEIDIEIYNDGSRRILFTTWVGGTQTNSVTRILPFDPSAGFHDYRIEWSRDRVRFLVDGTLYEEWTSGVPRDAMYVMSNVWWPTWLSGPPPVSSQALEIDRITY